MGFKFNPFSGNFDQTGSGGGGGAQYIDGEVATYNDLPLDGTAALNSAWLVRTASGVWPVSRKQAGIYIRTATAGSSRDADYTYAGTMPDVFSDSQFLLYDNTDSSKNLAFDLGGISTGTTRTLTVPDGSGTIQLALVRSSSSMSSNVSLSAGRARHITYTLLGGSYQVTLPLTGNQSGDVCRFTNSASSSSGAILTVARGNGSGGTVLITTLERNQTVTCFNRDGTETGWTLEGVDTHTHAASEITSGTLDNARINFAAPDAIGATTRNTIAATTLNANNGTLTAASAPVLDLAQTWNNAAVTFTGLRFNVTNTASAVSSLLADFQVGGSSIFQFRRDGQFLGWANAVVMGATGGGRIEMWGSNFGSGQPIVFRSGNATYRFALDLSGSGSNGVFAVAEANNTFSLLNGVNSQTFRLYNTFTDASNFERGKIAWESNVLRIGTEKGGTGSARALEFQTDGTTRLTLGATSNIVTAAGGFSVPNNGEYRFGSPACRIQGTSSSPQNITFQTNATDRLVINDTLLGFGGTTSSFPALKRSSTTLQVRLADDSADAPLSCGALTVSGNITHTGNLVLASTSTNNINLNTNNTTRWIIAGASGALQATDGVPLRWGGNTASFPRLVNSGAVLQCSLADGSAYAVFEALFRAQGTAPATSGATGAAGDIRYDADYIYVCTAANTWKRAAIATW